MRLALVVKDDPVARADAERVRKALERRSASYEESSPARARGDVLVAVGDSAFIIAAIKAARRPMPILGVGSGELGVLAELRASEFEARLDDLLSRRFSVDEQVRLLCEVEGEAPAFAVNEVALLAAATGNYVRYSLHLDGERLFRDKGDGVLVATPVGSTAYAQAAGGPVVLAGSNVLAVVPICSDEAERPLVVPADLPLELRDAVSKQGCAVVLDGAQRIPLSGETVRIRAAPEPARFVRFGSGGRQFAKTFQALRHRRELARLPGDAPPSAKFVVKIIEYEGAMTQKELIKTSALTPRTVRNAVTYLLQHGVIGKEPNLRDMRLDVYSLATPKPAKPGRP
ncbi:MAG: NAD(+)/NADH kinase [Methanobacteriota archaeon]